MRRTWLYQERDRVSHAYEADSENPVAACGNRLREWCQHCNRDDEVIGEPPGMKRCEKCDALAMEDAA